MSGKWVAHYKNWGGDVSENRHFIEGKLVAHYQNFEYHKWAIFFRWTTFEIQKQNMSLYLLISTSFGTLGKTGWTLDLKPCTRRAPIGLRRGWEIGVREFWECGSARGCGRGVSHGAKELAVLVSSREDKWMRMKCRNRILCTSVLSGKGNFTAFT